MAYNKLREYILGYLQNDIENGLEWERWEDPGKYPNGIASGPLPAYSLAVYYSAGECILVKDIPCVDIEEYETIHGEIFVVRHGGVRVTWRVEECVRFVVGACAVLCVCENITEDNQ